VKIDGFSMAALTKPARKKKMSSFTPHRRDSLVSILIFPSLIMFVVPSRLFHGITDPN